MKVYAYIRVSTEMQTYENQEYEIRQYCKRNSLQIHKWVSESISGTVTVERRLLGRTIRQMSEGDMIICTELSRLGRNMLMIMGILNICSVKGISIRSIKDNFELSDNINSKIIAFAFALAAEIERNLISQRTKEALAARKSKGMKLGRPIGSSRKRDSFIKDSDRVKNLIDSGYTITDLSRKYGIHRNTIAKYLKEIHKIQESKIG